MIKMKEYRLDDIHRIDIIGIYADSVIYRFQELMGDRWVTLGDAEMATRDYIESEYDISLEEA